MHLIFSVTDPIADTTTGTVNDDISFFAFGDAFGLAYGRTLLAVFRADALVALATYRPAILIGHDMLVPAALRFTAVTKGF
jgi:hypothetical protein